MKSYLLAAATTLALASCSNPLSKVYTVKTVGNDLEAIVESGKLDPTQCQLLIQYVRLGNEPLAGTTYQQLLDKATALKAKAAKQEAERQALAAKAAAAEAARLKQLRAVAAVSVFHKGFLGSDSSANQQANYITFEVAIENKSPKDIRAIMGMLVFNDVSNKPIKEVLITDDSGVKAGKTLRYGSGIDYNELLYGDLFLRYSSLDSLKIVWQPEKVLFADGTSMAALKTN